MSVDIYALESEFAKNPTLLTCIPLCEAYLQQQRYLEATVVCKKGIKNSPENNLAGRLMLVRIYLAQNKTAKAQADIEILLKEFPADPAVLNMQQQINAGVVSPVIVSPVVVQPVAAPPAVDKQAAPREESYTIQEKQVPESSVEKFLGKEALGFKNDDSDIETIEPGRLTMVEFMPKRHGSLRTTLVIALVLAVIGSAFVIWRYENAKRQKNIVSLFKQIRTDFQQDTYASYKDIIIKGQQILKLDTEHVLTLSALAYAEAILATEYGDAQALSAAQLHLAHAMQKPKEENEFRVAARALIAFATKNYTGGLNDIQTIMHRGGTGAFVELEAFRLLQQMQQDTKIQMRRMLAVPSQQPRVLNYLGWYYYEKDDWAKASNYFQQVLQMNHKHPAAIIGRVLVILSQNSTVEQNKDDIEKNISTVLAMPESDTPQSIRALALFARSEFEYTKGNAALAEQSYNQAIALDHNNHTLMLRHGLSLLKAGNSLAAATVLQPLLETDANNITILKTLAQAQARNKKFVEAQGYLDRVMALAPDDVDMKLLHVDLLLNEASYQQAIVVLEHLIEKLPTNTTQASKGRLLCDLGQAYEATEDKGKAYQSYKESIKIYPYDADCHFFLCRVLMRGPEAREACKSYLSIQPHGRFMNEALRYAHGRG